LFYRTKCNHCVEYRDMDYYMESDKSINMPLCPKCKSILIDEPRYQNIIKERLKDIQNVKKVLMSRNGNETYLNLNKKIILNVLEQIKRNEIKCLNNKKVDSLINIVKDTLSICLSFQPDLVQSKLITTYNILTQLPFLLGIEYYEKKLKSDIQQGIKINQIDNKFLKNYNIIKKYFEGFQKFNNDFFIDFKRKIQNLLSYVKSKEISSLYSFMLGVGSLNKKLESNNFNCTEKELENFSEKAVYETHQILRSLGTRWYKCPNGHLYVVGECGGPMERSICPECHARIGGMDHIPESGNQVVDINQFNNV